MKVSYVWFANIKTPIGRNSVMNIVVSVAKKNNGMDPYPHIINPAELEAVEADGLRCEEGAEFVKVVGDENWMFWEMRDECAAKSWGEFLKGATFGSHISDIVMGVLFMHRRTKEEVIVLYVR